MSYEIPDFSVKSKVNQILRFFQKKPEAEGGKNSDAQHEHAPYTAFLTYVQRL